MADSVDKIFPITTSRVPSLSGESNENEVNYDESSSKLHQPKKSLTKHFMSPTISASTKAAAATVTRKKILTDHNQSSNFFDTRLEKTPNVLDSSMSSHTQSPSRFIHPSSSRLAPSQSLDDEDQNFLAYDSSLKPYDPVTSYTSPRPKFLRYNPNRLHHPQNQTSKEDLMSFDSQMAADALNSVVSSSQESPKKDEESEFDENSEGDQDMDREEEIEEIDEEEIEEIDEERRLSLKDMLKFLLVFVALFFSTTYISSMNSPNPSPTVEALQDLRDGYYGIQQKVFEVVNMKIFEGITGSLSPKMERSADAELEEKRVEDENRGLRGSNEDLGEVVEVENVQKPDISDEPERNWEALNQSVQVTENTKKEDVIVVGPELENSVEREIETAEGFQTFQDHQVLGEEVVEGVFIDEEIKKSDEVLEFETAERFKSFQDRQVNEEVVDVEIAKVDEIDSNSLDESVILHGENEEEYETVSVESFQDRQVLGEVVDVEIAKVEETGCNSLDESVILHGENEEEFETVSVESDLKDALINKLAMIESLPMYKIGVPMFVFTILASLGLVYWSKHKKTSLAQEPSAESCETQYQKALQQEKIKKIEFKAKPSVFEQEKIKKTEFEEEKGEKGASKESSISQAPIVELLSELVIGEVSSSLKSSGVKNKLSEIEESNNSVSQEKTRSHITPSSSLVEFSAVDSPSYGSFTSVKKISKKEEAKDGEANMLITPVRRSSRIRNRAVMSP